MQDPQPVTLGLMAVLAGVCLVGLWFFGRPEPVRLQMLREVARAEQAQTPPPPAFLEQIPWLLAHRKARLLGMVGLCIVMACIGMCEGIACRHWHPKGGFLLTVWTSGVVLFPVLVGAIAAILVLPVPLDRWLLASVFAGLVGTMGFLLACGRPATP
jgi:hypothetical protein